MKFLKIAITALAASAIILPPTKADNNIRAGAGHHHHHHTATIDNVDLRSNNAGRGSGWMNAGAAIDGEDLDFTEVGAISPPTATATATATGSWQRALQLPPDGMIGIEYQFEYIGKGLCVSCDGIFMAARTIGGPRDLDACKAYLNTTPNAVGLGYDSGVRRCKIFYSTTIETVGRVDNSNDIHKNLNCYKIFDRPCPTAAPNGMPSVMPSGVPSGMPSVMPSGVPSTSPSSSSAPSLPVGKANKKKKKATKAKAPKAIAPSTLVANELKSGGAVVASCSPLVVVGVTFASMLALGVGSILF